jgi:hypothetical protein
MNGISFPVKLSKKESERAAEALISFSNGMVELERSAVLRAQQKFKGDLAWRNLNLVPLEAWVRRFGVREHVQFEKSISLIHELLKSCQMA